MKNIAQINTNSQEELKSNKIFATSKAFNSSKSKDTKELQRSIHGELAYSMSRKIVDDTGLKGNYGNVMGMRKHSNAAAQKEVAMGIYKAPVVQDRYKKVISHFKKAKLSNTNESSTLLQDAGQALNSSLNSAGAHRKGYGYQNITSASKQ